MLFRSVSQSRYQNATTIVSTDFEVKIYNVQEQIVVCTNPCTITITGTDLKLEDIKKIKFTIDTTPIYIYISSAGKSWEKETVEKNKIVLKSKVGYYYQASRAIQGDKDQAITLNGTTENIAQGTEVDTYTSSYGLEEIDNLREYILKQGKKEVLIKANSTEDWIGTSFIKDVLVGTAKEGESEPKIKKPIIQMEMGGLCLKTLQSDIFIS